MDVKASLKSLHMAPRKVRLVIDLVRGLPALEAETKLQFAPRAAALPVLKLLQSAMANAEHNFKLSREQLFVKTITADGGATLKRTRARAHGTAAMIRKRTTHIHLILSDERVALGKKKAKKVAAIAAAAAPKVAKKVSKPRAAKASKAESTNA